MGDERKIVTFTRLDQIKREPLRWVIDGLLCETTIASIVGRSGSCKSFISQSMAACVATGTPWLGRSVQHGAVFYLGGEGQAGIRKRFDGWSNFNQISLDGAPLYIASGLPALSNQLNIAAVIDEVSTIAEELYYEAGSLEPKLFIVDTLARAMAGADENSAAEMGNIIAGLEWIRDKWGSCVQVIHHTGYGEGNKERGRGSSAYFAALDSELLVSTEGAGIRVRSTKEKDWAKPPEFFLDRNIVDVAVGDVVETTLALSRRASDDELAAARQLREEVRQLKAEGFSIRGIAGELNISKSKVEHELHMLAKSVQEYQDATSGS